MENNRKITGGQGRCQNTEGKTCRVGKSMDKVAEEKVTTKWKDEFGCWWKKEMWYPKKEARKRILSLVFFLWVKISMYPPGEEPQWLNSQVG